MTIQGHTSHTQPVLARASDERSGAPLSIEQRQQALGTFAKLGFLQIDRAYSAEHIERLHDAVHARFGQSLATGPETVAVGDRRYMSSLELSGIFNDPTLYANATVFPVVNDILGQEAVLTSLTCVTALEGAGAQQPHADHPPLFPETELASLLPTYAVTMIIPLVALGPGQGATAAWLGSHHETAVPPSSRRDEDAFVPETTRGSVYLIDYRLAHRGAENATGALRPVLSIVYARPWFTDSVNFVSIPRLRMPPEAWGAVPDEWRPLFIQLRTT